MEDEDIIKSKNIEIAPFTYISKDEFLTLISNLNFKYIESANISFITHFKLYTENDEVKPRGFRLNLG